MIYLKRYDPAGGHYVRKNKKERCVISHASFFRKDVLHNVIINEIFMTIQPKNVILLPFIMKIQLYLRISRYLS
jgi:hypothetical protein